MGLVAEVKMAARQKTDGPKMAEMTERGDNTLYGTVKWFDPAKGFGFVVAEGESSDILLHANVLRNFGQSSIAEGAGVEVIFQRTARGAQAIEILRIDPPVSDDDSAIADLEGISAEELTALPLLPARIKWFDKAKGFGFANAFGDNDDIFIHIEVLRRSGLADLLPGEAIALRCKAGERGQMAVAVVAWETAAQSNGSRS